MRYTPTPTVSVDTTISGTEEVVSSSPRSCKGLVWVSGTPGTSSCSCSQRPDDLATTRCSSERGSSCGPGTCVQSTGASPGVEGPFRVIWKWIYHTHFKIYRFRHIFCIKLIVAETIFKCTRFTKRSGGFLSPIWTVTKQNAS